MSVDDFQSELRVVINRPADRTATAFLAGPYITVRELEISKFLVTDWLHVYRSKLRKATSKTMKIWPPEKGIFAVSLCLLEFVTESWRTMLIGSEETPSQIVVGWEAGPQNGCGKWQFVDDEATLIKTEG